MKRLLLALGLLFCAANAGAQTTTFNGVVKDLTNTPVPTGQITFTLKPGIDTTISGSSRFVPATTFCEIHNPGVVSTSGTGTITVVVDTAQNWIAGDSLIFVGTGDATLNASSVASPYTITVRNSSTSFVFTQSGAHTNGAAGTVGGLYKSGGTGACAVMQNTAILPQNTSYTVGIQAIFAQPSSFNTYAIGSGPIDISTVVPTPSQMPAYSFVDTFSNQASIGGAKTFTSSFSATNPCSIDGLIFVSTGGCYTTVQAAINALPSGTPGGGTVIIPPGTYACPTSLPQGVTLANSMGWFAPVAPPQIWSKFNGVPLNTFTPGTGSQNMVKFTGCALNITDVSQVAILGIVLDYGGTGNMTIKGVAFSEFAMAVVNTGTSAPAVTITGDTLNSFNTHNIRFDWLVTEGGNGGISVGNASGAAATVMEFGKVVILADTQPAGTFTAVAFPGNCDSNIFNRISAYATTAMTNWKGVVINSTSTTANTDADGIAIDWYDELLAGFPVTSTALTINPSFGNYIRTGVINSNSKISIQAWASTSTFTWDRVADATGSAVAGQNNLTVAQMGVNNGTPSYLWQKAGITKWTALDGASDTWFLNDTVNNRNVVAVTLGAPVNSLVVQANGGLSLVSIAFASLGTPASNQFVYCPDCTIANPCAGGGTGALAKRLNGVWVCN